MIREKKNIKLQWLKKRKIKKKEKINIDNDHYYQINII